MASRSRLLVVSLALHGALAIGIGRIEIKKSRAATAISYAESHKKKAPPAPAKIDPATPDAARPAHAARRLLAPVRAPATPPAAPATYPTALDALPDFGVSLSGGVNGTGIALPAAGVAVQHEPSVEKVVRKAATAPASIHDNGCAEPPAKPKPLSVPQPGYTDDARAAGVEGKVRVQLTVDDTGRVTDVKLIAGLGHGLDEAALAAARKASFEPAQHCGRATQATFTISMRFKLPS